MHPIARSFRHTTPLVADSFAQAEQANHCGMRIDLGDKTRAGRLIKTFPPKPKSAFRKLGRHPWRARALGRIGRVTTGVELAEANMRLDVDRARTCWVRAYQRCIHGDERRSGSDVPRHPTEQFVVAVRQSRGDDPRAARGGFERAHAIGLSFAPREVNSSDADFHFNLAL